jgi:hypothetical protein
MTKSHTASPQSSPQLLHGFRSHPHLRQEGSLRRLHLVPIRLCIEIERRLNPSMTQNPLHRFRVLLPLVHQPIRE